MDNLFNQGKNKCSLVTLQFHSSRITKIPHLQKTFLKSIMANFLVRESEKIFLERVRCEKW